jgi:hypothetical protein
MSTVTTSFLWIRLPCRRRRFSSRMVTLAFCHKLYLLLLLTVSHVQKNVSSKATCSLSCQRMLSVLYCYLPPKVIFRLSHDPKVLSKTPSYHKLRFASLVGANQQQCCDPPCGLCLLQHLFPLQYRLYSD